MKFTLENGRVIEFPDNCTKCGHKFEKGEGGFPFPEKQFLCKSCFHPALKKGLDNLNKTLAGENTNASK